jgi:hypothetical protein
MILYIHYFFLTFYHKPFTQSSVYILKFEIYTRFSIMLRLRRIFVLFCQFTYLNFII